MKSYILKTPKEFVPLISDLYTAASDSDKYFLVSRGSIISSARKDSAVRNGDLTYSILSSISFSSSSGFSAFSKSDLKAASIPPSIGNEPQSPDGHAYL